jgi:hypothetical protein
VLACGNAQAATSDPPVTVVVHLVLDVPDALRPAPDSYCFGDRRPVRVEPVPTPLFASYERALHAMGPTVDHFGLGTWTVGASDVADVAYEPVDHVYVRTRLDLARRVLPGLLTRMRRELHQQEALGEIFGAADPALGSVRTRIDVRLPFAHADASTLARIHRIFGDGGRSGASQIAASDGIHVWSSVPPQASARIEAELRTAGLAFTTGVETFVPVDAPRCKGTE